MLNVCKTTLEKGNSTCITSVHGTPYVIVSCALKKKNMFVLEYTGGSKVDGEYERVKDSLKVF